MVTVSKTSPFIKGLIYKDNILHKYTGNEYKPCAVDSKTLIKLIQCMSSEKITTFLPLIIENYMFTKKQADRLISEFLCSKEFYTIYLDIEQTYHSFLSNKVLKKNYIKKAKKKLLRTFFYLVNNFDEIVLCKEENTGILIREMYEEFIRRIVALSTQKEKKSTTLETIGNHSNFTLSANCDDSESLFTCEDNMEHVEFNLNHNRQCCHHENISNNDNYVSKNPDMADTLSNKNEFDALKELVYSDSSLMKTIARKCSNNQKSLFQEYKNTHRLVSKFKFKIKKMKDKLSTYKNIERRMTILEYKLDCLTSEKSLIKHSKKKKNNN